MTYPLLLTRDTSLTYAIYMEICMATFKHDAWPFSLQQPPPQCTELTGQRFGLLTVITFSYLHKRGAAYWHCLCDCGNTHLTTTNNLHRSIRASCDACRHAAQRKDLTGQRFHKLVVTS